MLLIVSPFDAHMHPRTRYAAQNTTRENTTHQLIHACASRGPICIREQDMQHNTQQERKQPTNSHTHAHREDLYAFENKTRSTTHNKKQHNPPTQTRMRIERTYMHSRIRHAAQHTTRENTTHQLKHACASRGPICIREQTSSTTHNRREHNPLT
jgi:site-specific DNA-cytosine methylase